MLKLTFKDGSKLRINQEYIIAYGSDDTNGANSFVSTTDGSYQVKETVEEIDDMLDPEGYAKEWK